MDLSKVTYPQRALERAKFFLQEAGPIDAASKYKHEAHLEAAILFARMAWQRLAHAYGGQRAFGKSVPKHNGWDAWQREVSRDDSYKFFRDERNYISKERTPRVDQLVGPSLAANCFEYPGTNEPAIETIERHLMKYEKLILTGERLFRP